MTSIKVRDIVGNEDAITSEDGQTIYRLIYPELRAGRPVELDFAEVNVFATLFFNSAVGQLLRDIDAATLNHLFTVKNLSAVGEQRMRRSIEIAKQYYSSEAFRIAHDRSVQLLASSC